MGDINTPDQRLNILWSLENSIARLGERTSWAKPEDYDSIDGLCTEISNEAISLRNKVEKAYAAMPNRVVEKYHG